MKKEKKSKEKTVLLISTYELGRQPFGIASPARWLSDEDYEVITLDLAVEKLDLHLVEKCHLAAFYIPMHTATRIAAEAAKKIKSIWPQLPLVFYGLYAPLNEDYLRSLGAEEVLGGEFEPHLLKAIEEILSGKETTLTEEEKLSRQKLDFRTPLRASLPSLEEYAHLYLPEGDESRLVGYTEASRGCLHQCRHCPVAPVYEGRFFIIDRETVLQDIGQQVEKGAQHITFGDPDFFNGPGHGARIVRELHRQYPQVTYDVTIKVEHLLKKKKYLPSLGETNCLFITTAVESFDDEILDKLDKGHTRADFEEALSLCRSMDLTLCPTFLPFTPWTTLEGYSRFLREIARLELIDNVPSIQLAIRLLIPPASLLLEREDLRHQVGPLDKEKLLYPWKNKDPQVDQLQKNIETFVEKLTEEKKSRREIFSHIWQEVEKIRGKGENLEMDRIPVQAIPFLTEPWYC